jgi:hypothetical protein
MRSAGTVQKRWFGGHAPAQVGTAGRLRIAVHGPDDRAHRDKAKINARLCSIGGFDPDDWGDAARAQMNAMADLSMGRSQIRSLRGHPGQLVCLLGRYGI